MVGSNPARPWVTRSRPAASEARALAKVGSLVTACWYTWIRSIACALSDTKALASSTAMRGFCIAVSVGVIKGLESRSICRHCRIDLHGPGVYSARQIRYVLEPVAFEESSHLHAARTVVADADDVLVVRQFAGADRDQVHRDLGRACNMAGLEFPVLAHVEQERTRLRFIRQALRQLRRGHVLHDPGLRR